MRWPLPVAALVALGCRGTDVVATGLPAPDAGALGFCAGDGPPFLVGDGVTVGEGDGEGDDVCTGDIAVRTFRHALCTCEDYVTSTRLTTDSFDSAVGPYTPGGAAGPVGIDGALGTADLLSIGGDLTVGGSATLGAGLAVAGAAGFGGDLRGAVAATIGGDAAVAGDVELTSVTVGGTLTVPDGATVSGALDVGELVRAPVAVAPPCACQPDDLVDIADFVAANRATHDNATIGLPTDRLTDYAGDTTLELPCGRYYLGPVRGDGALTVRATGRVILLIDGDVTMTAPLAIELAGADAELDLIVGGLLTSGPPVTIGDPARPSATRLYLGGDGTIDLEADSRVSALIYAPRAALALSGAATLFGSLFVRRLEQAAPVEIHYDVAVLRVDSGLLTRFAIGAALSGRPLAAVANLWTGEPDAHRLAPRSARADAPRLRHDPRRRR